MLSEVSIISAVMRAHCATTSFLAICPICGSIALELEFCTPQLAGALELGQCRGARENAKERVQLGVVELEALRTTFELKRARPAGLALHEVQHRIGWRSPYRTLCEDL